MGIVAVAAVLLLAAAQAARAQKCDSLVPDAGLCLFPFPSNYWTTAVRARALFNARISAHPRMKDGDLAERRRSGWR